MKTVSVLTTTYNRCDLMERLFESLCKQSNKDFEWIIIDDGSDDGTDEMVKGLKCDFPIIYRKKNNGGKHTALNIGFDLLDSKYTIIVDSDDVLTPDAVDTIIKTWNRHKNDRKIGVVTFLRIDEAGVPIGGGYPVNGEVKSLFKTDYPYDKAETFRTEVLRKFKFPEIKGEKFIGEGVVWNKIAKRYLYAFYNKGIYVCEYLEGGLTKSGRAMRIRNPRGGMINANIIMSCPYPMKKVIKSVLLYGVYACFCDNDTFTLLKKSRKPFLSFVFFPVSYVIFLFWKIKYRNQ